VDSGAEYGRASANEQEVGTKGKKRSSEFKRYRQVLVGLYIGAASAGFCLLVASVIQQLYFRTPSVKLPESSIVAGQPDPRQFLICNDLVKEQLFSLTTKTNSLFAQPISQHSADGPARDNGTSRSSDWKDFSTKWQDQWDVIDARCRFTTLAETKMGEAYDRMAHVHGALPAMRLKFNSLLAEFDREQADELRAMSRALAKSKKSILKMPGMETVKPLKLSSPQVVIPKAVEAGGTQAGGTEAGGQL